MEHTNEELIEDHALEQVPKADRQGWLALTWNTAGIVTTLIQLFFGALLTFVAGLKIAVICGVIVTIVGGTLGSMVGHIAYKSGLSSTVMSRFFGFGKQGSIIASLIFAFMIIGFLAIENALLYKGFLFAFNWEDTLQNAILIYGTLSIIWIILTAYGFELVAKFSSITLIAFMVVLIYITYIVVGDSMQNVWEIGPQFPMVALQAMGADTDLGKYIFGINLLIGSAGALALVDGDMGRYSKSSKDISIAAFIGLSAMSIVMVFIGGLLMHTGVPALVEFYTTQGMNPQTANQLALSPDGVTASFILLGGILGTVLMILAQSKAQVLNSYSASLSLSNLFDALGAWKPGRLTFVILANLIGLVMLYGQILALVNSWITILGVLTTTFAGIMIADFFIIRKGKFDFAKESKILPAFNWAGIITTFVATILAHYVLNKIIPIEFVTSLATSIILYTILRKFIFKG